MSTPPWRSSAKATMCSTSPSTRMSVRTKLPAPPRSTIAATAASPPKSETSATTTVTPSSVSRSTIDQPAPDAPPVTIATRPLSCIEKALAPVAVAREHELLGQGDPRRGRRIGDDRHRLGDRAQDAHLVPAGVEHDLVAVVLAYGGRQPRLEALVLQVVQQVLGLVLQAQDLHRRAGLDVGQRDALDARAGDDRVPVRAGLRVADGGQHALLQHRRHRVLQPLGLLVDLVPRDPEDVSEKALDEAVAAHDALGVLGARVGEGDRLVARARDVAVALEATDHLVD